MTCSKKTCCGKVRFVSISVAGRRGDLAQGLAADSVAGSSTGGKGAGEGVAVLHASWGGYDEALTVGAGIYFHG